MSGVKLAVLGAGKMGGILLEAFLRSGLVESAVATVQREAEAKELAGRLGVVAGTDNVAAVSGAEVILLGVKPWQVAGVVKEIVPVLRPGAVLVSIAAGLQTATVEEAAGGEVAVIRAMPNTPAQVGEGATALCPGRWCTAAQMELVGRLFGAAGRVVVVDEKQMDAVTGVSGSGPAFLYLVIEALADGGVNVGLTREVAITLAAQTALGAAKMVLETGIHPAQLKDMVTTPNGTTVAGLLALEEGGVRAALIDAVRRTAARAKELAKA